MAARDFGENDLMVACAENNIELVSHQLQKQIKLLLHRDVVMPN